jgi:hypothetical protein
MNGDPAEVGHLPTSCGRYNCMSTLNLLAHALPVDYDDQYRLAGVL